MATWIKHGVFALLGLFLSIAVQRAVARDFTVTNTEDALTGSTLRQAIITANELKGSSTIYLGYQSSHFHPAPVWTFHLTLQGQDEDVARTGDLDITAGNLTIIGKGSNVVIDASELEDRVFQVFPKVTLTLENLTITGGQAPSAWSGIYSQAESGGAILNAGTLVLKNCIISNNISGSGMEEPDISDAWLFGSAGADGGGICSVGKLQMTGCQVFNNSAGAGFNGDWGGSGGGIASIGSCTMTKCIVASNAAGEGGAPEGNVEGQAGSGGSGGGIMNIGPMVMNNCIVSNNLSGMGKNGVNGANGGDGGGGAGIDNNSNLTLTACVIVNNLAGNGGAGGIGEPSGSGGIGGDGAGIYNVGTLNVQGCTISRNQAGQGGDSGGTYVPFNVDSMSGGNGGDGGDGGGIFNVGPARVSDSIIAFNSCGDGGSGSEVQPSSSSQTVQGGNGGNGGSGGGVYNYPNERPAPVLDLQGDTINSNQVGTGGNPGTVYLGGPSGDPGQNGTGPDVSD